VLHHYSLLLLKTFLTVSAWEWELGWISLALLNIWLLSWFAFGYAYCNTLVYFNFYTKFQTPNTTRNCQFAVCYYMALKQEVVIYSAEHGNKAVGHDLQ
jgi:hypothetical protein